MTLKSISKNSTLTENEILNKRLTQWLNNSEMGIKGWEEPPTPTTEAEEGEEEKSVFHKHEKQDKVKNAVVFSGFVSDNVVDVHVNQTKKKKNKRRRYSKFLLLIRAVLLETSFIKMIRKRKKKLKQRKEKSISSETYSSEENVKTSSSRYSSSCSSYSVTSNARNQSPTSEAGTYWPKIGFLYILISLCALIFWGKACAIVCTSTWLFFIRRRSVSVSINLSSRNNDGNSKFCSERYKKKEIVEDLIERNNSI